MRAGWLTRSRAGFKIHGVIRDPTVFILGAGASEPYDFPLGGRLVDLILQGLFHESPRGALLKILGRFREGDVEEFRQDLQGSGLRSIDAFLEGSTDVYVDIGKVAIAHTVLLHENRDELFGTNRAQSHWYEYVWNLMRPDASRENLTETGLAIITFNYERSFEYYLTTAIKHSFRMPRWKEAWSLFKSAVPVVHLHGEVGDVVNFGAHTKPFKHPFVHRAAEHIRIVHDPMAQDDPLFKEARRLIANAQTVAFIGFGYHPTNATRLNLQGCLPKAILDAGGPLATVYKMGNAQIQLARDALGVPVRWASPGVDAIEFLRGTLVLR